MTNRPTSNQHDTKAQPPESVISLARKAAWEAFDKAQSHPYPVYRYRSLDLPDDWPKQQGFPPPLDPSFGVLVPPPGTKPNPFECFHCHSKFSDAETVRRSELDTLPSEQKNQVRLLVATIQPGVYVCQVCFDNLTQNKGFYFRQDARLCFNCRCDVSYPPQNSDETWSFQSGTNTVIVGLRLCLSCAENTFRR